METSLSFEARGIGKKRGREKKRKEGKKGKKERGNKKRSGKAMAQKGKREVREQKKRRKERKDNTDRCRMSGGRHETQSTTISSRGIEISDGCTFTKTDVRVYTCKYALALA